MGERTSWTETWRKGISPEEGQGNPRGEKSLGCSSDSWRDADYKFGVKGVGSDWHIRIWWLKTANKQCSLRSRKEQTADKQAFSPDTKTEISLWVQGVCFGSYCSWKLLLRKLMGMWDRERKNVNKGHVALWKTGTYFYWGPSERWNRSLLRVASCWVRKLR